jgi:hypothetical protein
MYPFTAAMLPCTAPKYPNPATVNGYFKAVVDNNVPIYRSDVAMYRDKVSKSRNGKWILDRGN